MGLTTLLDQSPIAVLRQRLYNRFDGLTGSPMAKTTHCESCSSKNLSKFPAEIAIHFPGGENIDRPAVFLSPQLAVCLACGRAQFSVGEAGLRQLSNTSDDAADCCANSS
jgi:hypothetical protein